MSQFAWSDKYSVAVKSIDRQHANLFGICNELYEAMKSGQGRTVVGPLLKKMLEYTRSHFADEEKLMAQAGYPDLANHRTAHVALTRQVTDYFARFEKGEIALSVELLNFLSDWLKNHILGADMQYSPFMKEKGLA